MGPAEVPSGVPSLAGGTGRQQVLHPSKGAAVILLLLSFSLSLNSRTSRLIHSQTGWAQHTLQSLTLRKSVLLACPAGDLQSQRGSQEVGLAAFRYLPQVWDSATWRVPSPVLKAGEGRRENCRECCTHLGLCEAELCCMH